MHTTLLADVLTHCQNLRRHLRPVSGFSIGVETSTCCSTANAQGKPAHRQQKQLFLPPCIRSSALTHMPSAILLTFLVCASWGSGLRGTMGIPCFSLKMVLKEARRFMILARCASEFTVSEACAGDSEQSTRVLQHSQPRLNKHSIASLHTLEAPVLVQGIVQCTDK